MLLISSLGPALALYRVDRVDEAEVERQRTLDALEHDSATWNCSMWCEVQGPAHRRSRTSAFPLNVRQKDHRQLVVWRCRYSLLWGRSR